MLQEPHSSASTLDRLCEDARLAVAALNQATADWHSTTPQVANQLLALHRANFDLWHLEDEARDPSIGDAAIAAVKRSIDRVNQHRNDTVEAIDSAILASLAQRQLPNPQAPLHSETPGQMLDRLSILALKIFHTADQVARTDVEEQHRARNRARLAVLQEQQADLACCLTDLWRDVMAGRRRIKLYRQHKMYNDPALNPVLYRHRTGTPAATSAARNSSDIPSS